MGFVEARERLGAIWRAYRRMRRIVREDKPDLLVLIDFAEFNMALAGVARRAGVPVLYYISPQVWAWRRGRVRKIARRVSRLAVVFPFEVPLYAGSGVRADFVGHPLLDMVRIGRDRAAFLAAHGLHPEKRLVALLPGSRAKEMQLLLPPMAEAAARLAARGDVQCVLALADTLSDADIAVSMRGAAFPFPVVRGETYDLVHASDVAIVASGTATLETALLERPMVIVYRTAPLTYALARRLVSVPFIGMPNLIAGRGVVPELIQDDATADRMVAEVERFLDDQSHAAATRQALAGIRPALGGGGAAERAAAIAAEMLA
jgi:lipid-A-disaccharide synthase